MGVGEYLMLVWYGLFLIVLGLFLVFIGRGSNGDWSG